MTKITKAEAIKNIMKEYDMTETEARKAISVFGMEYVKVV